MEKTPEQLQAELEKSQQDLAGSQAKVKELEEKLVQAKSQEEFHQRKFTDMGNELGELRKKLPELESTISELTEKISGQAVVPTTPPQKADEPAPEEEAKSLAVKNDALEEGLDDAQQETLTIVFDNLDEETQTLVQRNEEARNEFIKQVLPPEATKRSWRRDTKQAMQGDPDPDIRKKVAGLFEEAKRKALTPAAPGGRALTTQSGQARTHGASPNVQIHPSNYLGSLRKKREARYAVAG